MSPNRIERVRRSEEFKANQRRRRANQIKTMIAELDRMCADLKLQTQAEEMRAQICDPTHFDYSTYAKTVRERCARAQQSADILRTELGTLKLEVSEHAILKSLRAFSDLAVDSAVV
jgi:flagellar FliJ protein